MLDKTYALNLASKDSITEHPLNIVQHTLPLEVVFGHHDHVVAAHGHLVSSMQADLGPIAGLQGLVPHDGLDVAHVAAEALQPKPGQQLHGGITQDLSSALLVHGVHVVGHPEGVAHMQVIHVSVQINVFGEVRDAVVLSQGAADSLAPVDHDQVLVGHLDAVVVHDCRVGDCLGHLHHESLVHDMAIDKEVGVNFIGGGERNSTAVCSVEHAGGEGISEHASVNALPQPARGPDKYVKVLGEEHDLEDLDGLIDVQLVRVDEDFTTGEHAHPEGVDELLHDICLLQFDMNPLIHIS